MEEVAGQQPVNLGAQEGQPGGVAIPRRWANPVGAQDAPHGRLAEPVAQAEEFPLYAAIPPAGVLSGEPGD
ncbi:MAG TPA: hypothetical protein VN748_03060 [Pseudonocardiaceae bacterium]|nr:hypothetical protein [Pseudonocardiaceae bacterium]